MNTCRFWLWTCVSVFVGTVSGSGYESILNTIVDFFGVASGIYVNENLDGLEGVRLILYKRSPKEVLVPYEYSLDQSIEMMKYMDLEKPFVLYFFGYQEHPSNESVQTVVSAYLQRGTDNIAILDWSDLACDNYVNVFLRMKDIAKYTAKAVENLVEAGLNTDTIHLIGHSMGAQVAGFVGRYLRFTVPRVTGLDPANPLFYQFGADHIDSRSGRMVDVIHTDRGFYGAYGKTGTADFFANGGSRPQPGCALFGKPLSPRGLCSHWRSWRFYAESVINNEAFPALQCDSYETFMRDGCEGNQVVYFGYAMPKNISGTYFFLTNAKPAYGRGFAGLRSRT